MQPCDPSINSQLFRLTRINVGQNPKSLQPGKGQNGPIAQILDRDNNLCLLPGDSITTTIYDPSTIPGCIGSPIPVTGRNVIMSGCTGGGSPGYVWLLLPSIEYQTLGTTTPPQIVYIGNLDLTQIPDNLTAIIDWLRDNNATSLYYGGNGTNLILNNISVDNECLERPATVQYMTLPNYNTISRDAVCFAQDDPTTCTEL